MVSHDRDVSKDSLAGCMELGEEGLSVLLTHSVQRQDAILSLALGGRVKWL